MTEHDGLQCNGLGQVKHVEELNIRDSVNMIMLEWLFFFVNFLQTDL